MAEFVDSFETMANQGPLIPIFGSARIKPDNPYYQSAEKLAALLVGHGYGVDGEEFGLAGLHAVAEVDADVEERPRYARGHGGGVDGFEGALHSQCALEGGGRGREGDDGEGSVGEGSRLDSGLPGAGDKKEGGKED